MASNLTFNVDPVEPAASDLSRSAHAKATFSTPICILTWISAGMNPFAYSADSASSNAPTTDNRLCCATVTLCVTDPFGFIIEQLDRLIIINSISNSDNPFRCFIKCHLLLLDNLIVIDIINLD